VSVPPGTSFLKVVAGPAQPQLAGDLTVNPEPLPKTVAMPDASDVPLPDASLLADRTVAK